MTHDAERQQEQGDHAGEGGHEKAGQACAHDEQVLPRPGVTEKKNGTRKAGSEYFQACIIDPKGWPPVTAAAAEGESPTGGDTSESTAK